MQAIDIEYIITARQDGLQVSESNIHPFTTGFLHL